MGHSLDVLFAELAGLGIAAAKALLPARRDPPLEAPLPTGISVVVPSRDGRHLLETLLPGVVADLAGTPHEIVISDNGSSDGTADYLRAHWPQVAIEPNPTPLPFAAAVNRGIRRARYAHVCLLNNDMVVEPGFFRALTAAFHEVPELFCSTAQIFFPAGERRQETGLAVKPPRAKSSHDPGFPLWCNEPAEGEDGSWVLYGSGGCSLYDTRKLRALGMFAEMYAPAYVEDLDIGFRAWQRRWPTVYVAQARVLHHHRATTSRFFTEEELALVLEANYLRFLAGPVATPRVFLDLWRENLRRGLNRDALRFARRAWKELERPPASLFSEEAILALGSGQIRIFPGAGRDTVLIADALAPEALTRHRYVITAENDTVRRAAIDQARHQWPRYRVISSDPASNSR